MGSKSFNWLKDGILPLSIAIMITCWLSSWMLWIRTWPVFSYSGPILSPLSIAAVLVVSTYLTRVLLKREQALEKTQVIIGSAGLVAILLFLKWEYYGEYSLLDSRWLTDLFWALSEILKGIPPQLAGLALGAYLWRRGITLGRESVEFGDVMKAFQIGIVALIGLLILSAVSIRGEDLQIIQQQAIPAVLTFFFFSLLALSLSRLEAAREEARRREGKSLGFSRDWLLVAIGAIVAIVLLGFLVTSIFSFDLAARMLGSLLRVADLVMIPVFLFFLVIGFFLQYIIYFIQFLLALFHVVPEPMAPGSPEVSADEETLRKTAEANIPPAIIQAIEWLILAAIVGLVLYIFVMAIIRLRRGDRKDDVEEIRESLWSWQTFLDDVKVWLRSLWLRLGGRRRKATGAVVHPQRSDPQYLVSLSIRQIYQSLLSNAPHLGFPKGLDETPYEYLRVVEAALPSGREDLLTITEAYVKARYSGQPAMASEFQVADMAWARVQAEFRSVLEDGEKGTRLDRSKR